MTAPAERAGRRVLVCDDAPLERAIFARYARREGWHVSAEAADAASALLALEASRPDLIVLDGRLPPAGGLSLLPALLARCPGVPVLFVAALEEVAMSREALRLGAAGALGRPLLPSAIAEHLRRVARTAPPERE